MPLKLSKLGNKLKNHSISLFTYS